MQFPLIGLGLIVALVLYVISLYNSLQVLRTRIAAAIQEIGNQLKRQASLIPSLLETLKGYAKHEKDIYGMITAARTSVDAASKSASAENINSAVTSMQNLLPKINVLVESNPELKANENFTQFMAELRDTADKLMYSRRLLIDLSQDFNARIITFPGNILASMLGFKPEKGLDVPMSGDHITVSEAETKDPKVSF